MDPFAHLNVASALKDSLQSEKNNSSFAVALGLATRQLDIFGYFKFVTAVSNINLLPNKKEREKKEKKKIETNGLAKKLMVISSLLLWPSFALYISMATSM